MEAKPGLGQKPPLVPPSGDILGLYDGVPRLGVSRAYTSHLLQELLVTSLYFSTKRAAVSNVKVMAVRCDVDQDDPATGQRSELLDVRNHPSALGGHHHLCGVFANLDVGLGTF